MNHIFQCRYGFRCHDRSIMMSWSKSYTYVTRFQDDVIVGLSRLRFCNFRWNIQRIAFRCLFPRNVFRQMIGRRSWLVIVRLFLWFCEFAHECLAKATKRFVRSPVTSSEQHSHFLLITCVWHLKNFVHRKKLPFLFIDSSPRVASYAQGIFQTTKNQTFPLPPSTIIEFC